MPWCILYYTTSNSSPSFRRLRGDANPSCVCWLDMANTFGSVHHDLIAFPLTHYHAPPEMIRLVSNLYDGLTAVSSTSK